MRKLSLRTLAIIASTVVITILLSRLLPLSQPSASAAEPNAPMTYKVIEIPTLGANFEGRVEGKLNEMSKQGWEFQAYTTGGTFIFKKKQ